MNARRRLLVFTAACALAPAVVRGEVARKRRLGILWTGEEERAREDFVPGISRALAARGYVEGRNLEIDLEVSTRRAALEGARNLAARNVDVVLTQGTLATRAIVEAAPSIPVVTSVADPVEAGFAKSLARPGGNVTGLSQAMGVTARKNIELLARLVPGARRVAVCFREPDREIAAWVETAARALGLQPVLKPTSSIHDALATLHAADTPIVFLASSVGWEAPRKLAAEAIGKGIATGTFDHNEVVAGFLLAVDSEQPNIFERSAALLARVLEGTRPAEIPFEFPTRFVVTLNRSTAAALRLRVPPDVLLRIDDLVSVPAPGVLPRATETVG